MRRPEAVRIKISRIGQDLTMTLHYRIDKSAELSKRLKQQFREYMAMALAEDMNKKLGEFSIPILTQLTKESGLGVLRMMVNLRAKDGKERIITKAQDSILSITDPAWLGGTIDGQQRVLLRDNMPLFGELQFSPLGNAIWGPDQCEQKGARCCLLRRDHDLYAMSLNNPRLVISCDFERTNVRGESVCILDLLRFLWSRLLGANQAMNTNLLMIEICINSERTATLEWTLLVSIPSAARLLALRQLMGFLFHGAGLVAPKGMDPIVKQVTSKQHTLDSKPLKLAALIDSNLPPIQILELNRPSVIAASKMPAQVPAPKRPPPPVVKQPATLAVFWSSWQAKQIMAPDEEKRRQRKLKELDAKLDWPYPFTRDEDVEDFEGHPVPDGYTSAEKDLIGMISWIAEEKTCEESGDMNGKLDDETEGELDDEIEEKDDYEIVENDQKDVVEDLAAIFADMEVFDWADELEEPRESEEAKAEAFESVKEDFTDQGDADICEDCDESDDSFHESDMVRKTVWEKGTIISSLKQALDQASSCSMLIHADRSVPDRPADYECRVRVKGTKVVAAELWPALIKAALSSNHPIMGISYEALEDRLFAFRIWFAEVPPNIDNWLSTCIHARLTDWNK